MNRMTLTPWIFLFCLTVGLDSVTAQTNAVDAFLGNGIKIGEVTADSAIIWTRITSRPNINLPGIAWENTDNKTAGMEQIPEGKLLSQMEGALPGAAGSVQLAYWIGGSDQKTESEWHRVRPEQDFTHQFKLSGLNSGTQYQLEMRCRTANGFDAGKLQGSFQTAPAADQVAPVRFTVVTGQDYPRRDDGNRGHRIYPAMQELDLSFFVHTGDIEYYDKALPWAPNVTLARYKWNRLYGLPNQRAFHNVTPSYFIKDDHDTLKNDCWPGQNYGELTWEQGLDLFREQVPMGDKTYRTVRWGKDLQIWLVEGRDFRSPNRMPDGPGKTIWGAEQKKWFFETVQASDATFRILISPTPLVGPDRTNKGDNHANKAFETEGKELRAFIASQKNMYSVCGDRHWQYVSVHPDSGVREYSCGPTSNKHAGGWSKNNVSPMHQYLNVTGGFLSVTIERENGKPVAIFRHHDVEGKILNEDRRPVGD